MIRSSGEYLSMYNVSASAANQTKTIISIERALTARISLDGIDFPDFQFVVSSTSLNANECE